MPNLKKADVGAPDAFGSESDTQLHLSPTLGLADGSHADIPSPARVLQQRLLDDLNTEAGEDDGRRWAPRTTLLVASGASLALWGVIALAIAAFH
jgi:hypothetical protein